MSASFSPAELNYNTHDKELLAIIRAFEHWRIFLEGTEHPVTVLTDHKNLEYWKSARTFNRRHVHWHLTLASYNFVIAYQPGKQSQKPDTLSRPSDHIEMEPSPQIMLPETEFEAFGAEITTPLLEQIKEALQDGPRLDTTMAAAADPDSMPHSISAKFKDYTLQDGLPYQGRIVVPDKPEIKQKLLSHFHDSPGSRHQGRFQVNCYVESCEICQRNKGHVQHFALKLLSVPAGPWEDVSYDFIVRFPKCRGNNNILVVVDCFSKIGHFIPCKETATAEDVAQLFLEHVWKLHGTPKQTVLDRGPTFNSKFLRALYKVLHIAPSYSTTYHLQYDVHTEIKNQWLEAYLRPFINHRQSNWVDWLPLAEFAHNNAKNKATGKSPFEIVYGCSPMISLALEPTGLPAPDDRAKQLADTIQEVQASIKWAQERYKQADKGKPPPEFAPGAKVCLLASDIMSQCPNKKLDHTQYGPFSLLERIGSHAYLLVLPETMKIHDVFHVSLLTAYKSDKEFKRHFTLPPPMITAEGKE
ncbi:Retrotransposable element Tf2 155 kDa protein type 1 OS=Schizosaccharomyces pombe (strain 972 / ATCC 24843) GN=Tf2-1 PE=4 SV=1 [Rhizoctonia solani AG-1 IB]|uniref:Retrotransposable element Tf2 155 kDa protein type 1 n=1 Tax=Thanatephorus cucumeris (strain AG1-IB / isolate 7/3/14) TaxID=1108050 RepID=A0A0B7FF49_THACB|nr:Retrotransposable element Tf2 155 kDa protein type 1 OS=Schizosaccharomyces pombe (strain 972 / ATCC 24843) GN=Tf2-1 PE=4 SV=1 [Rhizoctonia solani AG-1 IB]